MYLRRVEQCEQPLMFHVLQLCSPTYATRGVARRYPPLLSGLEDAAICVRGRAAKVEGCTCRRTTDTVMDYLTSRIDSLH